MLKYIKTALLAIAVVLFAGILAPPARAEVSFDLAYSNLNQQEKAIAYFEQSLAISREVKELAVRAKAMKLKPAEFEGGTFAISNLGMFGVRDFTAVINPPQAAILAVGAGEQRAVVKTGALAIANVMTVQMSCDHRVIDGALGATWLEAFKGYIEDPVTMLV